MMTTSTNIIPWWSKGEVRINDESKRYLKHLAEENHSKKLRQEFIKKLVISGFSIEELETGEITLRPRGAFDAMLRIRYTGDTWHVVEAAGAYAGFARGRKREYFQNHLDRWWQEVQAQQEK